MAETLSNMIPLGTKAPTFRLYDTCSGRELSLQQLKSDKATVIMFICNHCPFVKNIQKKLVDVAKSYKTKGVNFIAISSNDVKTYPQDGPDQMRIEAEKFHYPFPYLYDETQEVAKAYQATCTPDFFVLDKDLQIVYRGRFDDSTPGNRRPITGTDLSLAIDNILAGTRPSLEQKPSIGCNIKWKKRGVKNLICSTTTSAF